MTGTEVYDRVYFQDDYKQQFDALRDRYHDRTQKALKKRAVDHAPVPNATTIIYLHDEPDGGVTISSGDFVEYFNSRYGGKDRIGAVRASLANAAEKAEKSQVVKMQRSESAKREGVALHCRTRMSRAHNVLVNAVFTLLLMLSIGLLSLSGVMLEHSEAEVMVAQQQANEQQVYEAATFYGDGEESAVSNAYLSCPDKDTTEVFSATEKQSGLDMLRCALQYLW